MTTEKKCVEILERLYKSAENRLKSQGISDSTVFQKVDYVARCSTNRAAVRLLMSCLLAKIHQPKVDVRKPYTEIGGDDTFSGRSYDEKYLSNFINKYELPCNATTAFLTPALRNINIALEKIKQSSHLNNYIFITTEPVKDTVLEFAKKSYSSTGVEIAILDCIGFIKHFLYLFYRIRMNFLDEYQKLVLNEPASSVSQELKEAFIVLRRAGEQE
ncbi:MAG: hypothetical protein OXJ52_07165 [Oligoflexia bacterium]|nr:hypothetical protein [Oligoflexia bacterium]